uniref:Homeobox domain-containing protein n=1 Tax=Heterosigma akashiwo TaxID=2829 RepID=A0A7S3Y4L3_HETAK
MTSNNKAKKAVSGPTKGLRFSRETTRLLEAWLYAHRANPYPTKKDFHDFQQATGCSIAQLKTWFVNNRSRKLWRGRRQQQATASHQQGKEQHPQQMLVSADGPPQVQLAQLQAALTESRGPKMQHLQQPQALSVNNGPPLLQYVRQLQALAAENIALDPRPVMNTRIVPNNNNVIGDQVGNLPWHRLLAQATDRKLSLSSERSAAALLQYLQRQQQPLSAAPLLLQNHTFATKKSAMDSHVYPSASFGTGTTDELGYAQNRLTNLLHLPSSPAVVQQPAHGDLNQQQRVAALLQYLLRYSSST